MRRTNGEIETIKAEIVEIVTADHPMTLRGLFYRLVAAGEIAKDEDEYKNVGRYLLQLRRDGILPYSMIADNTRWMRKGRSYDSLEEALHETARTYRRALWTEQNAYVEVWCEKDTLAGILYEETQRYDVPLMVVRGFSSETFLHNSACYIEQMGKPAYLYLLTDLDPSGLSIASNIERKIREFVPEVPIRAERIAVTPEQVEAWELPTRPTKKTDSRARNFGGESVELDAIPPALLRTIVRDAIEAHIDPYILDRTRDTERLERETLWSIRNAVAGPDDA